MAEYNGGFQSYPNRTTKKIFFRADDRTTKTVTVKAGQVLKALSFVESDKDGKVIAHTGIVSTGANTPPTINKIAGVLLFDVDATGADVEATAYTEASFWASALTWSVDTAVDVVTKVDGTTVAVTAYNTNASTNLLKQKLVEGTEFEPLGFLSAGEQL